MGSGPVKGFNSPEVKFVNFVLSYQVNVSRYLAEESLVDSTLKTRL